MKRFRWGWLALCATLTACGDPPETGPALSEVRDSAGIAIVTNRRPPADRTRVLEVGPSPSVSIGTLEGDAAYQLFRVVDATKLPDGRIVVANRGTNELRVFDEAGVHLATWGREGEGPGEFTGLSSVAAWAADSVLTWDFSQRRISIFDSGGALGRTFRPGQREELAAPQFVAVLPGPAVLVAAAAIFSAGEDASGVRRPDRPYFVLDAEGAIATPLGAFPGRESYIVASEQFVSVTTHPFGRGSVAAAWGSLLVLGGNDAYELRAQRADGTLVRIVRLEHELESPTESDLEAFVEQRLEGLTPEERRGSILFYEDMPLVEAFPAFDRILVDALDHLWVREFSVPGARELNRWTVFDPQGVVLGTVALPTVLEVIEIGVDYVLGTAQDDFEVEYVQLWSLSREAS